MPIYRSSSRATNLLQHQRTRGRSYPTPRYWERLYQMLEEEAEKRGKTAPPPPLTHRLAHGPAEGDVRRAPPRASELGRSQQPSAPDPDVFRSDAALGLGEAVPEIAASAPS